MRYPYTVAETLAHGAPAGHPDPIVTERRGQSNASANSFVTTAARLPVLIAVALAAACQHSTVPRAELPSPITGVASGTLVFVDSADARHAVNDVVRRIAPSLTDTTAGRLIADVFKKLQQSLDDGDVSTSLALIGSARAIVDAYGTFGNDDTEQLRAIRVALTALANSPL